MTDDYMAKVERDWRNADYRDSIIEECERAITNIVCLHCGSDNTDRIIKALRALKDKP